MNTTADVVANVIIALIFVILGGMLVITGYHGLRKINRRLSGDGPRHRRRRNHDHQDPEDQDHG